MELKQGLSRVDAPIDKLLGHAIRCWTCATPGIRLLLRGLSAQRDGEPIGPLRPRSIIIGVVPDDRIGKIDFYEAHLTPWITNAVGIGLVRGAVATPRLRG